MRTFFWLSVPESHLLYISLSIYKNMLKHLEMFVSERYLFCIRVSEPEVFVHSWVFPEFPILLQLQGYVYC